MTEEIKKLVLGCWRTFKAFCRHQYEALLHIDFRDNTNKTILRIVLLNFAVIFVISMFWMYGIWVLIIYSVGLFIFLRKYLNKVQEQYQGILIDQSAGGRESGFPDYRRRGNFRAGSE